MTFAPAIHRRWFSGDSLPFEVIADAIVSDSGSGTVQIVGDYEEEGVRRPIRALLTAEESARWRGAPGADAVAVAYERSEQGPDGACLLLGARVITG